MGKSLPQTGVTIERRIAFIPGVTEKTICSRMDFTGFKGKEEAPDVNFFDDDQEEEDISQYLLPSSGPPLGILIDQASSSSPSGSTAPFGQVNQPQPAALGQVA